MAALKDKTLDTTTIEKLSTSEKELLYKGALELANGFLNYTSWYGNAVSLLARIGLLALLRKELILIAAMFADDCGLINSDKITVGDKEDKEKDKYIGNLEITEESTSNPDNTTLETT